jgi:hypothetical protein
MTSMHEWRNGIYPWDFAKCGCCMLCHLIGTSMCSDPAHDEFRDVVLEQGLDGFAKARGLDWVKYTSTNSETPEADKWLNDNYDKCVAIRELFRDHYANNPAPPEQMELPLEPVAAAEV